MSLLNQIIKEAATKELIESAAAGAVSAGAVAGFAAPLGGNPKSYTKKSKNKNNKKHGTRMKRRAVPGMSSFYFVESDFDEFGFDDDFGEPDTNICPDCVGGSGKADPDCETCYGEGEIFEGIEDQKFDQSDVLSKLTAAQKKAENEDDATGFALEDEEGRIVKVFVAPEQAEDFEQALGAALVGPEDEDANADEDATSVEIAEILFNLKDRFTIVDVEWPEIEEDQEEPVEGDAETDLDDDLEGETDGEEGEGEEGDDLDMEAELQGDEEDLDAEGMEGGEDPMSALKSIIDLLKSQADAQKAEAQAKEAEANADEAKHNAAAATAKVKQEEEVLDMEAYYDEKNQADKEAKKLAKLAKWKHETAQEAENKLDGEAGEFEMPEKDDQEEEEEVRGATPNERIPGNKFQYPRADEKRHEMQPGDFIKYMLKSAQRN